MSAVHDVIQEECDRQLVLLALAELTLSRPGFDDAAREIAKQLKGERMFDEFKRLNADRVKTTHGPLGPVSNKVTPKVTTQG